MSECEHHRCRKSRPDKTPVTVAVQDAEQKSAIYQFLKKARENRSEEKFLEAKHNMTGNQVTDQHRNAAKQTDRPSPKEAAADSQTFQKILILAYNQYGDDRNDTGQQMLCQ